MQINEKYCPKCKQIKNYLEFSRDKSKKDGYYFCCKACRKKLRSTSASKISQKSYHLKNKERIVKRSKEYYEINRLQVLSYQKDYYNKNIEKIKSYHKKYRRNPENKKKRNTRERFRQKTDIQCRLSSNLRKRTVKAIKIDQKSGSAVKDLGCSILEFKDYIESLFEPGMTWNNWGRGKDKWHLDHILPLRSFDLSNREEFLIAANYKNIQPLWETDNLCKGEKVPN